MCKQCGYAYCGRHCSKAAADGQRTHYRYYRCTGTDGSRFAGSERVCTNTQVRSEDLDEAVWQQVCALLSDPQRLTQEYSRRLQALTQPADDVTRVAVAKQLRHCVQGMSRLIDAYTEGYIEKSDFESRIGGLRERRQALEQQQQLNEAVLSKADLRLIIGRLEDFAAKVDVGLARMDFAKQCDLIRTLVKRVEIDREHVNVVFRVESVPGSNGLSDCWNRALGL